LTLALVKGLLVKGLPFAPSSALRKSLHMQWAPLNYAALLRALKLRLILRQDHNPAHFGGFIFFSNPN